MDAIGVCHNSPVSAHRCHCPAKVNLNLAILGRDSATGMHFIDSVIAKISLYDDLFLDFAPAPGIAVTFESNEPFSGKLDISPQDNTLTRAYGVLCDAVGTILPGMSVHIIKRIPIGSGLGGGSSDAAGLFRLLRNLARSDSIESKRFQPIASLSDADWATLAAQVGADVPAFMIDGPVRVQRFGDEIEPITLRGLEAYVCTLHFPGIELSTAEMYGKVVEYSASNHTEAFLAQWRKSGPHVAFALARNDFTPIARDACPGIRAILDGLGGEGYIMLAVSGSGSTVFGILPCGKYAQGRIPRYAFLT